MIAPEPIDCTCGFESSDSEKFTDHVRGCEKFNIEPYRNYLPIRQWRWFGEAVITLPQERFHTGAIIFKEFTLTTISEIHQWHTTEYDKEFPGFCIKLWTNKSLRDALKVLFSQLSREELPEALYRFRMGL